MSSSESPRPEARGWAVRAFTAVEGIVYIGLGLLLTGIAFTLLAPGFIGFERIVLSATTEAATDKLFRAAEFQLLESGWWDVAVVVEGPHGPARVRFGVQAGEPLPRWLDLWPWFSWPALVVALFAVHRALVRRRATPAPSGQV